MLLMGVFAILSLLFLAGCGDKADTMSAEDLLYAGEKSYESKHYTDAEHYFDSFELRFPLHKKIPDVMFKRAVALYRQGNQAAAVPIFEMFMDRYPTHKAVESAQWHLFFCYYNQITNYERDFGVIQKAYEHGIGFRALGVEDETFDEAFKKLQLFLLFSVLRNVHLSLEKSPKLWGQMMWHAENLVKNHGNHEMTAEAYYRMIEFLVAQNTAGTKEDAKQIFKMMRYASDKPEWKESVWYKKSEAKIAALG